jgi:hypothetical protein
LQRKLGGTQPPASFAAIASFADQSVVAIQNARLFESVEARTRELAKSLEDLRTTRHRLAQTQKLDRLGPRVGGGSIQTLQDEVDGKPKKKGMIAFPKRRAGSSMCCFSRNACFAFSVQ